MASGLIDRFRSAPRRTRLLLGAAGFLLLLVIVVRGMAVFSGGEESTESLMSAAQDAPDASARECAAARVADRSRAEPQRIQRLYREARDPGVKAVAVQAMGDHYHYESMPMILAGLEDPSPAVRQRAKAAAARLTGYISHWDPNGTPEERRNLVEFYKAQWRSLEGSQQLADFKRRLAQQPERSAR